MQKNIFFILIFSLFSTLSLWAKDVSSVATIDTDISLNASVDYHITSSAFGNGSVNLTHPDAWIILDSIRPKVFLERYYSKVKINGQPLNIEIDTIYLSANSSIEYSLSHIIKNARVSVYGNGTVIIPQDTSTYSALELYTGSNFTGESLQLKSNVRYYDLGEFDDEIVSFKLKRGYMATLAVEADGRGFSRVFVADTADVEITELPKVLANKVSFIAVFDWSWPSKRGWCSSGRNAYNEIDLTESTWWYSWSADRPAFANQEYVPIKQNGGWPSTEAILSRKNVTHLLGFNEPDRSDQANATVQQAIDGWETLMSTGLRLGSPAIADNFNWLYEFMDECDKRNYRVDFVAIHAYWGGSGGAYNVLTNGQVDVKKWYNKLKEVHDRTGRPLWITEWNNGANWTNNGEPYWSTDPGQQLLQNEEIIREIIHMLDTCSFVERYSLYNWVSDRKAVVQGYVSQAQIDASNGGLSQSGLGTVSAGGWSNQFLTPAGVTYSEKKSPLAYNPDNEVLHQFVPTKPTIQAFCERTKEIRLYSVDYNGIMTDSFVLERKVNDGEFETILTGEAIPDTYYDQDLSEFTEFTKLTYRVKIQVDNVEQISDETSVSLGIVNGTQSVRTALADLQLTDNEYFYISEPYDAAPIVVSGGVSYESNRQMFIPVVSNVNKNFFNYKIAYWSYMSSPTFVRTEEVSALSAQEGVSTWGNLKVEARTINNLSTDWQTVTFTQPFDSIPVLFSNTSTSTKDYPLVVRFRNITTTGFEIRLTRELIHTDRARANIGWVAIEQGSANVDGKQIKVGTIHGVGEVATEGLIDFGGSFNNPTFLASIQTSNDDYTYGLRYYNKTNTNVKIFKQLEKSKGNSYYTNVKADAIGYVVAERENTSSVTEQLVNDKTFRVYPTITPDMLTIDVPLNTSIEVFNLQGLKVFSTILDKQTINVSDLSAGMYIIRTSDGKTGRFIKK